jgi:hypothetical protein
MRSACNHARRNETTLMCTMLHDATLNAAP